MKMSKPIVFGLSILLALYGSAQASGPMALLTAPCFAPSDPQSPVRLRTDVHAQWRAVAICDTHVSIIHSAASKTPLLVMERLNAETLRDAKKQQRSEVFLPDPRLAKSQRAELADYRGSGYHRGHLAAAANQPSKTAMDRSFWLSNIIPQDPYTNSKGAWAKVESDTRKYVRRAQGDVYVFSGPIFDEKRTKTIGPGRVWVPHKMFKLVYDAQTQRAWAHIIDNTPNAKLGKPISYKAFVEATGWHVIENLDSLK